METVILRLAGLFFLVVAVAPWAVAYRLSLPSSSSGSASGDLVQGELECNCKVPPYSNPSGVRVNPTNEEWEELMLEGPCYLACAKKYQVLACQKIIWDVIDSKSDTLKATRLSG